MRQVTVYTDGACQGNPGPGGWAAVIQSDGETRELSGGEPLTTNNRMELRAAIEALRSLPEPSEVVLYTDSEYLRNGITAWLPNWKARGWRTAARTPVKNADLWRELDAVAARHRVTWRWLPAHAGQPENERADRLAVAEIRKLTRRGASRPASGERANGGPADPRTAPPMRGSSAQRPLADPAEEPGPPPD
jgi:ribonuclease HI